MIICLACSLSILSFEKFWENVNIRLVLENKLWNTCWKLWRNVGNFENIFEIFWNYFAKVFKIFLQNLLKTSKKYRKNYGVNVRISNNMSHALSHMLRQVAVAPCRSLWLDSYTLLILTIQSFCCHRSNGHLTFFIIECFSLHTPRIIYTFPTVLILIFFPKSLQLWTLLLSRAVLPSVRLWP